MNYINKFNGLFICSAIQKTSKLRASYGYLFNSNRLKNGTILLPIDNNGNPNWQFMEDYIKQEMKEQSQKIVDYYENKLLKLGFNLLDLEVEWKEFFFTDIFKEVKRGKRLTKANQKEGDIPYVSSTALNNGIDNFISNNKGVRKYKNNLSIANSGSVGSCFYHKYEYIASDHIKRSGRYSNTDGWTIIEINTTTNSGYRNPIYVWDYTDGSRFICKSFTDAMDLTGVSKSSIDKSLKSSLLENCPYIKGYKFFRVGETPEKMVKMTKLEALYWVFVRIYYSASNLNTPGYIVYDEIANKAYPALSLDDVKNRFLPDLPENKISALVQLGSDYRGIKVYQIYQRDGSRLLGVEPTQSFKAFELTFNGEMVLCNDKVA